MARGIDYSFDRPSPVSLKSAGYAFVCRYLSVSGSAKNLTKAEAKKLTAAGLKIVCVWEHYGDWAHDLKGGRASGVSQAKTAAGEFKACGGPSGKPIYFAVDFDASAEQLVTVGHYFQGVAAEIGLKRVGAYGGYATIKHLFDAGLITYGWQTLAWSGGKWDARAQLRQVAVEQTIHGAAADLDVSHAADFGQW
jgi:hypothetical protein